jgi:hypothetical protein
MEVPINTVDGILGLARVHGGRHPAMRRAILAAAKSKQRFILPSSPS